MKLITEPYLNQVKNWPNQGQHILAQFNDDSIIVYQAYNREIGHFAATQGYFGNGFKLNRMSWIKPNFLWMMYRCGWGTKVDQEVVLAITLHRKAFDQILGAAVHSTFVAQLYENQEAWQMALKTSQVRLQWDPDHDPAGVKQTRRAIQLGLRGEFLQHYAQDWIIKIEDISEFVRQQRCYQQPSHWHQLIIPQENVYPVSNSEMIRKLGLSRLD